MSWNKSTTLLALAAGALLTASGSGDTTTPVAPLAARQSPTSTAATPLAPVAVADIDAGADDRSGDGATAGGAGHRRWRDIRCTGGPGRVVIRIDDDRDGRVLGSATVPPGRTGPVTVTLTEPVPTTDDDPHGRGAPRRR